MLVLSRAAVPNFVTITKTGGSSNAQYDLDYSVLGLTVPPLVDIVADATGNLARVYNITNTTCSINIISSKTWGVISGNKNFTVDIQRLDADDKLLSEIVVILPKTIITTGVEYQTD